MKKLVLSLVFLAFCILLIHAGSLRLYDWYETGQLLVHKKQTFGPDYVSYNSDPVSFVLEFSLNLFSSLWAKRVMSAAGGVGNRCNSAIVALCAYHCRVRGTLGICLQR
jgi:hypothetical protein